MNPGELNVRAYVEDQFKERKITFSSFKSVVQAAKRIHKIYTPRFAPVSLTMLKTHVDDIQVDCEMFQGRTISHEQVEGVLETLHNVLVTNFNFTPEMQNQALSFFFNLPQRNDIITVDNFFSEFIRYASNLRKASGSRTIDMTTRQHPAGLQEGIEEDRLEELATEETGYDRVIEKDANPNPKAKIMEAIAQLENPAYQQIVLAKMTEDAEKLAQFNPKEIEAAVEAMWNTYHLESHRRNISINAVDNQDKDESTGSEINENTSTGMLAVLRERILPENGGLRFLFTYIQSLKLTSFQDALPTMTLLHHLGYYHPEETTAEFFLSERTSDRTIYRVLMESIYPLMTFSEPEEGETPKTLAPRVSLREQLRTLQEISNRHNNGERIKIPTTIQEKAELIYTLVKAKPELLNRFTHPLDKEFLLVIFVLNGQNLNRESLYAALGKNKKDFVYILNNVSTRVILRLLDKAPFSENTRRIAEGSYRQQILGITPSQDQLALIQVDSQRVTVYDHIITPNKQGGYQILRDRIDKQIIQDIAAILGFVPLEKFTSRKLFLVIQIVAMRLGMSTQRIISLESSLPLIQYIIQYAEKVPGKLEKMAQSIGCSVELLRRINTYNPQHVVSYRIRGTSRIREAGEWMNFDSDRIIPLGILASNVLESSANSSLSLEERRIQLFRQINSLSDIQAIRMALDGNGLISDLNKLLSKSSYFKPYMRYKLRALYWQRRNERLAESIDRSQHRREQAQASRRKEENLKAF